MDKTGTTAARKFCQACQGTSASKRKHHKGGKAALLTRIAVFQALKSVDQRTLAGLGLADDGEVPFVPSVQVEFLFCLSDCFFFGQSCPFCTFVGDSRVVGLRSKQISKRLNYRNDGENSLENRPSVAHVEVSIVTVSNSACCAWLPLCPTLGLHVQMQTGAGGNGQGTTFLARA